MSPRPRLSAPKKTFRSTGTWPCALTACARAVGEGLLVSFLTPNRLGFATLFLPGQAGFSRKSLRRFGEQPAEKPFDLRRQHPDELLRSRAQAGTLEHHKDTERQEHDRHVFLVEVHSEVPSGELLARRWTMLLTLRRISPVLNRSPAHARARVHKCLTGFSGIYFFGMYLAERTCAVVPRDQVDLSHQALVTERRTCVGSLDAHVVGQGRKGIDERPRHIALGRGQGAVLACADPADPQGVRSRAEVHQGRDLSRPAELQTLVRAGAHRREYAVVY